MCSIETEKQTTNIMILFNNTLLIHFCIPYSNFMSGNTTINKQNKFTLKKSLKKFIKTQHTFTMKQLILPTVEMK